MDKRSRLAACTATALLLLLLGVTPLRAADAGDSDKTPKSLIDADALADKGSQSTDQARLCEEQARKLKKQADAIKPVKQAVPPAVVFQATEAASSELQSYCEGAAVPDKIISQIKHASDDPIWNEGRKHLTVYGACLAYAEHSAKACDLFESFDPRGGQCLRYDFTMSLARAVITGGSPDAVCSEFRASRPQNASELCPIFKGWPASKAQACTPGHGMVAGAGKPEVGSHEFCRATLAIYTGDPGCAAAIQNIPERKGLDASIFRAPSQDPKAGVSGGKHHMNLKHECENFAAFRRAYEAKDAKLCGGLPLCRAMMGGGVAGCKSFLSSERDRFCGEMPGVASARKAKAAQADTMARYEKLKRQAEKYTAVYPPERQELMSKVTEQTKKCSDLLDAAKAQLDQAMALVQATEPKTIPGIDTRRDRIMGLQSDLNELHDEYLPPLSKQAAAAAKPKPARPAKQQLNKANPNQ